MAETDKGLEKAIDDHLKRLQERYKANIKVFNATHIGHISLAIVFLISILFPFLYLQVDTRKVNLEMADLSQKIERQQQRVAAYNRAVSGLKRVFEAVENTPKPLGRVHWCPREGGCRGAQGSIARRPPSRTGRVRIPREPGPLDGVSHPAVCRIPFHAEL